MPFRSVPAAHQQGALAVHPDGPHLRDLFHRTLCGQDLPTVFDPATATEFVAIIGGILATSTVHADRALSSEVSSRLDTAAISGRFHPTC